MMFRTTYYAIFQKKIPPKSFWKFCRNYGQLTENWSWIKWRVLVVSISSHFKKWYNSRKYLISSIMFIFDWYAFIQLPMQSTSLIPPEPVVATVHNLVKITYSEPDLMILRWKNSVLVVYECPVHKNILWPLIGR